MEGEGSRNVRGEVRGIVPSGIKVKFVGDFAGGENFVEHHSAGIKAVIILITAVEINFQAGKIGSAHQHEGAVGVPESSVRGDAEDAAQDASARRIRSAEESGKFFDERGAVRADSSEKLGMPEGQMERAIAAHGNSGNGAVSAAWRSAIVLFDEGKKLPEQKIFVANFSILCIDVETGAAGRRGDQEIFQLAALAQVLDEIPQARMHEKLFVVAKAMQLIEDGKVFCFVGVERGGEHDAVRNIAAQNFAGDGVAFDAAGGEGGRDVEEGKKYEESGE